MNRVIHNSYRVFILGLMVFASTSFCCSGAEIIGYAWPKKDLLIPDPNKATFKPLQPRTYSLVKKIDSGYIVLWETTNGRPTLARIPFRDMMGNPIVDPYSPPLTVNRVTGIEAQQGCIPLEAGEKYPVLSQSDGKYLVMFSYSTFTQTVAVAETDFSFASLADYTGILTSLVFTAERQVKSGANADQISSIFTSYHGNFTDETAKERQELAKKYARQITEAQKQKLETERLAQKRKFEAEQTAKGLVEFHGEWITPQEKTNRQQQEAARQKEKAAQEARYEAEQKARGLIQYKGSWMTPEQAQAMHRQEQKQAAIGVIDQEFFGVKLGEQIQAVQQRCANASITVQKGAYVYKDKAYPAVIYSFAGSLNTNPDVYETKLDVFENRVFEIELIMRDGSLDKYNTLKRRLDEKYGKDKAGVFESAGSTARYDTGTGVSIKLDHSISFTSEAGGIVSLSYTHDTIQESVSAEFKKRIGSDLGGGL